mmetsp:Transcript_22046/g.45630  ORF Transcript_22046/g.45630 Transcript_22046/m.45630 type:complete len:204 (-) Transcript_22046:632-1243(-)
MRVPFPAVRNSLRVLEMATCAGSATAFLWRLLTCLHLQDAPVNLPVVCPGLPRQLVRRNRTVLLVPSLVVPSKVKDEPATTCAANASCSTKRVEGSQCPKLRPPPQQQQQQLLLKCRQILSWPKWSAKRFNGSRGCSKETKTAMLAVRPSVPARRHLPPLQLVPLSLSVSKLTRELLNLELSSERPGRLNSPSSKHFREWLPA